MHEETIFARAVEKNSPVERDCYLDEACAGNVELRARLERLLEAHLEPDPCFDAPPDDVIAQAASEAVAEAVGSDIGCYRLLELIGEGGMGLVFMAEQLRPLRRLVALKIIKPGMDTRQVVLRFEAERQTLALMEHPHIAKILDSGTTESGRPYFVMELVRGISITDYCDQAALQPRDRLALFLTVCQAVQHAHQHGIIHRDLKPPNILVTMHDDIAVAKVIDFGVAKALHRRMTEQTVFTSFAQLIGTPAYMSPEQAQMSGLDVDTRSDVYSLGVLLYELLTGTTPFDRDRLRQLGYDDVRRIIREEDPPAMSSRLSTLAAERLSTVSERRGTDARRLASTLRGELDWIVMKALEKNRERRYESASELARDVRRHLDDQPVAAHSPSASYRFRKFARRNRNLLLTGCLIGFAMVAGATVSIWQAIEATGARDLADERLVLANDRLNREKEARRETEGERKRADNERQRAESNFEKALELVDRMLTRVGYDATGYQNRTAFVYRESPSLATVGDRPLVDESQIEQVRSRILDDVLAFYMTILDYKSDDARMLNQAAATHLRIGAIYASLNRLKERDLAVSEGRRIWEELHSQYPTEAEYAVHLANVYNVLGWASGEEQYHRQAAALLEPVVAQQPNANLRSQLANTYRSIGSRLAGYGHLREAESFIHQAIALCRDDPGWGQDVLASSLGALGEFLEADGRLTEAILTAGEAIQIRKKLVAAFPDSAFPRLQLTRSFNHRVALLTKHNRPKEAEDDYRQALRLWEDVAEVFRHDRVRDLKIALIDLLRNMGRADEAIKMAGELPAADAVDLQVRAQVFASLGPDALADIEVSRELSRNSSLCRTGMGIDRYGQNGWFNPTAGPGDVDCYTIDLHGNQTLSLCVASAQEAAVTLTHSVLGNLALGADEDPGTGRLYAPVAIPASGTVTIGLQAPSGLTMASSYTVTATPNALLDQVRDGSAVVQALSCRRVDVGTPAVVINRGAALGTVDRAVARTFAETEGVTNDFGVVSTDADNNGSYTLSADLNSATDAWPNTADIYSFDVASAGFLAVAAATSQSAVSEPHVQLALFAPGVDPSTGTPVATSHPAGSLDGLIEYHATVPGVYLIKVQGGTGMAATSVNYSLVTVINGSVEVNGTNVAFSSAQDISGRSGVLGAMTTTTSALISARSDGLYWPTGVVHGSDGKFYVASQLTNSVLRYDASKESLVDTFVASRSGGLTAPVYLAFGADGNLYVGSRDTNSVKRYNGTTGTYMDTFASGGDLHCVEGLTFGPDGNLYVVSRLTNSVLRYDAAGGAFLDAFIPSSSGGLSDPTGLVFGRDGNLYVSSRGTDSVLRYDGKTGDFLGTFALGGGLIHPHGLVFGPDGNLYVSGERSFNVLRYHGATGAFIDAYVSHVDHPVDLDFAADGSLCISDFAAGQVLRAAAGSDFYRVTLSAGQSVTFTTSTPEDGPGPFSNNLDAHLDLYDSTETLVAHGMVLADGRNEQITFTPPTSGTYFIKVSSDHFTLGTYVLSTFPTKMAP